MIPHRPSFAVLLLAAACATTPSPALRPSARAAVAVPVEAAAVAPQVASASPRPLDAATLALWNDPEFQRRFTESYVAETEIEPRVTQSERTLLQRVMTEIAGDRLDAARELLEGALGPTASAVVDFTLANVHSQLDRYDAAAASYAQAVAKYPKFRRAWKNLALAHLRLGDVAAAGTALLRVVELGGSDAVTWGLLGFAHGSAERFVAAESAYRMAVSLDPATVDWQLGLARSLFKLQRFQDAAGLCSNVIAAHPDRGDLWLLHANAQIGLGQPLKAAEGLEMVERLGKATAESRNSLGDVYANAEIDDRAVACYRRALELDPACKPDRALRAARLLASRGAVEPVRALLLAVEELRGKELDAAQQKSLLHLRARIALAGEAPAEHLQALEEIVRIDPLDGDALLLLGQHAAAAGDVERAIAWYERAAGIEAFEADAKVRHAQLLVKQGKYTEALVLLRRAQTLKPRDNVQQYLERVERFAQGRP